MKFLLLASGGIAERFVRDARFTQILENNLIGAIASEKVLQGIFARTNYQNNPRFIPVRGKYESESDLIDLLLTAKPDYVISIQFPWILSSDALRHIGGRFLNLHNAKLPNYRGHNSISHEILNKEESHFTTLHWIAEEVDRGKIVLEKATRIFPDDTAYSLWSRSVESALDLIEEWFLGLEENKKFPTGVEVSVGGKYYSKIVGPYKKVRDDATVEEIYRTARAFWFPPHEPAYLSVGGAKLYLLPQDWYYDIPKNQ